MDEITRYGKAAKAAARRLARFGRSEKDAALHRIADLLIERQDAILAANAADLVSAEAAGTSPALLDRMLLTPQRLATIASDVRTVAGLPDPVGERFDEAELPNGLHVYKRRVPLGVVGVVYEARPNVTVDIAVLCLKTGNAAILRGGSDIRQSCAAITAVIAEALERSGLPVDAVQSITNPDRALIAALLRMDQYVDMIIPRGGAGLHRFCVENATVPVITGGIGVVHLYVEKSADIARALPLIFNAKAQRVSVCNALDTLLVDRAIAAELLPQLAQTLASAQVELRCDEAALAILQSAARAKAAIADDFGTEFMDYILAVRVVDGIDDAIEHIAQYGNGHTEAILTQDRAAAARFTEEVDASAVFVNASTRFNDGGQLGLGAEVAISTQKLHARGPLGLRELTTYKWVGEGDWIARA
jgi:glutamate-5-semialdehyde dehydrogenase